MQSHFALTSVLDGSDEEYGSLSLEQAVWKRENCTYHSTESFDLSLNIISKM